MAGESAPGGTERPGLELTAADLAFDGPVTEEEWLGAPTLSYPNRPRGILAILARAVRTWPGTSAFIDEQGARVSYQEFAWLVSAGTRRLRERGVGPGDRVAVAARNRLDMAVAVFACAAAGAVLVGLNVRLARDEWAYMIRRSRARLALAQPELLGTLRAAADEAGLPGDRVGLLDLHGLGPGGLGPGELGPRGDGAAGGPPDWYEPGEDETYQVVWTSGTTGRPKASQVVHRCSVHSAMSYQKVLGLRPGERTAVLFPLYYISAMHAHVLPAMLAGATCVLVETTEQGRWLDLLAEHSVAWAYAVPSWWSLAARDPRLSAQHLPALRIAASGGAPFPAPLVSALSRSLPAVRLIDIYGLSETHSPATMLIGDEITGHPRSVGRALPCMEVTIRGDDGQELAVGLAGEVWLRGSLVTTGYLDDPAATSASITGGWFRTGDVGRLDAEGFLYLLDRKKDMINRGGHKVFSAEVERVIRDLPGVADVAVVPAPDGLAGEAVAAVVVPSAGAELAPLTVKKWVRDRLADYAAPGLVRFADDLPRNPTGKTDKAAVRRWLTPPGL